ncbi:MAG TPA: hypothetical protein VK824_00275 [Planctomycetota bacterium]|nr:hypothetical protein [Planctomycetota bacterium]
MRSTVFAAVRVLVVAVLWCGLARADVVHLKDGRTVEGQITARTDSELTVKTDFGTIVVPMSTVASIEEKRTPAQELVTRRAALPSGDAAGLYELAIWARDQQLVPESRTLLRDVLALVPDHALANEALGRVKVESGWLEPADVPAYVKAHEAEKKAAGLLWQDGRWLPEAEAMARRGFVRAHDAWVPRRQGETTLLVEQLQGLAIPLAASSGEFITLFCDLPPEQATRLVASLDEIVRDLLLRWPPTEAERKALTSYDIPVIVPPTLGAMGKLLDSEALVPYGLTASLRDKYRTARGFMLSAPRPLIGLVAHGEGLAASGDEELGRTGALAHQLGRLLVQRFKNGARTPGWVENGMAAFYESAVTQNRTLTLTSKGREPGARDGDLFLPDWEDVPNWLRSLQDEHVLEDLGSLDTFLSRRAGDMNSREVGVGWSLLRFLFEHHPDELLAYVRVFDTGPDSTGKLAPALHKQAWVAAFAEDLQDVQRSWEAWVLQQQGMQPPQLLSRPH